MSGNLKKGNGAAHSSAPSRSDLGDGRVSEHPLGGEIGTFLGVDELTEDDSYLEGYGDALADIHSLICYLQDAEEVFELDVPSIVLGEIEEILK